MVELGPASGEAGGRARISGTAAGCARRGLTGPVSVGEKCIGVPSARRAARRWLEVKGARLHNLQGVDTRIPWATLTAVTGVSGSGKSTWCTTAVPAARVPAPGTHGAKQHLGEPVERCARSTLEAISEVVLVDRPPLAARRAPTPSVHQGVRRAARHCSREPLARARAYTPARSRQRSRGAGCDGAKAPVTWLVEMVFLANVFVPGGRGASASRRKCSR